jgi:hypothetical protein
MRKIGSLEITKYDFEYVDGEPKIVISMVKVLDENGKYIKFAKLKEVIPYLWIMTEQAIQKKRIKQLEEEGYYVIKLVQTNKNGIPDLIAIPPNSDVLFSEVKRPEGKLSKLQEYRIRELKEHGCRTELYRGG